MGKTKKVITYDKDEGQKKISNFFQKAADKKSTKSGLFKEVGSSASSKSTQPKVMTWRPDENSIVLSDSEEFIEPKVKLKTSTERKHLSRLTLENDLKDFTDSDKASRIRDTKLTHQDPVLIPETQFDFTPDRKTLNSNSCFKSPSTLEEDILDSSLVPDTPENLKPDQEQQTKRKFGRSYLLSSTEFAANPIQKAKENREAKLALKKKQMSAARKSLVSVSVNFSDKTSLNDGNQKIGNKPTEGSSDNRPDGTTPTKLSENGMSLKRMAKQGTSPEAKRNSITDYMIIDPNEGETESFTVMKNLNFDEKGDKSDDKVTDVREREVAEMNERAAQSIERLAQKRKEKLERLEHEKQARLQKQRQIVKEQQKKDGRKQMNYQLHGHTGLSKQGEKSIKDDDILDNILDELNSSKSGSSLVAKQSVKPEKSAAKDSSVPKPDVKQPMKKRYSLEKILKFGQVSPKDQENKMSCQFSSSKKASDLFEKLSSEWTTEDDALLKELDMKSEIKYVHKDISDAVIKPTNTLQSASIKPESSENDLKDSKTKKIIEINSVVSDKKLKHSKPISNTNSNITYDTLDGKMGHRNGRHNSSVAGDADLKSVRKPDVVDHDNEDMIVDATPAVQGGIRRESDEHADIDEFMTQLDSEYICDEIENFTPFKDKRSREGERTLLNKAPCVEFGRHTITRHERSRDQIVLEVLSQTGDITRHCYLHGNWQDTHVSVGDTVHILAQFQDNVCHITDQSGFIVVNPDLLLSGTTVVGSLFCMRRSILKEKFKGCEKGNMQMLFGSILHSVFQEVLRKGLGEDDILEEASRIVKQTDNLLMIYSNDVTEERVMEEVQSYLPQIKSWTKQYTSIGKSGRHRQTDVDVLVTKVNDIEENIWSPRLGIKGKIDLTVDVVQKGENGKRTLPLELKTGRPSYSIEHKGQVTLYSMMSSDRRQDPGRGLLLYLKEPSMKVIPADPGSKAGLIQLRNEMSYYITRQVLKTADDNAATYTLGTLPDPISNMRACEKCPQLLNCAIYHRDVEERGVGTDSKGRLIQECLNHLSRSHLDYYTHWSLMLDLETQADRAKKTVSDIWCLSSNDREGIGACFSGMVIQTTNLAEGNCHVCFVRHNSNHRSVPLSSVGPVVTDSVVISCESLSWIAVCTGFIKLVTDTQLHVYFDREGVERLTNHRGETFRVDLCDNFSTAGIFYTNVSQLMSNEHRFELLRSLIIDRVKPEFQNTLSKTNIEKVKGIFKSLNKPQKTAILKVLMSKHYVLIRGYPGTGKTSTIVAIVKVLNILGLSVLLTSYTHSAVDNILLKLKKDNAKFLRLGRISKVHPDVREHCADILTKNIKSVQELETFFKSQMIVATSCLGTKHPLFSHRTFDVCIIDEASQVLQPACLGPLFSSKRFILVGDSKQLPPVVQSKEARELGMDESLFVRLDGCGATFDLNLQYRMNSEIMSISNSLIYNNRLKCGTDVIANRTLTLPDTGIIQGIVSSNTWLNDVLDNRLNKSVVFVNTEHISAPEQREKGGVVKNEVEAKLVKIVVTALLQANVECSDIGIIAPYRSQVFLIRNYLNQGQGQMSHVEVNTVDQYQGRDKSVIVISFVRSSGDVDAKRSGQLLNDVRRLNVAMTRAKCKLVMLGNVPVLQNYKPLREIIHMATTKQQIVDIPHGAIS